MAFGVSNDIKIVVELSSEKAQKAADKLDKSLGKTKTNVEKGSKEFKQFEAAIAKATAKGSREFQKLEKQSAKLTKELKKSGASAEEMQKALSKLGDGQSGDALEAILSGHQKAIDGSSKSFASMAKIGVAAIATVGVAAVGLTAKLLETAGRVEGLQNQFEKLNLEAGNNPTEQIEKLNRATQGLLTNTEIFEQFNTAATLGLPVERFEEFSAAAIKVGRSVGVDAAQAIESFVTGTGRQSALMLDNLGIIVKAEEAYQKFAEANNTVASALSEAERKMAFQQAAIDALIQKSEQAADIQITAALAYEQVKTALANQFDAFALAVSGNENLSAALQQTAEIISNLDFEDLAVVLGDIAAASLRVANVIGGVLAETLSIFGTVIREAIESAEAFFAILHGIANFKSAGDVLAEMGAQQAAMAAAAKQAAFNAGRLNDVLKDKTPEQQMALVTKEVENLTSMLKRAQEQNLSSGTIKDIEQKLAGANRVLTRLKRNFKETGDGVKSVKSDIEKFSDALSQSLQRSTPEFEAMTQKAKELTTEMLESGQSADALHEALIDLGRSGGPLDAIKDGYREAVREQEKIRDLLEETFRQHEDIKVKVEEITKGLDLEAITQEEVLAIIREQNLSYDEQIALINEVGEARDKDNEKAKKGLAEYQESFTNLINQIQGIDGATGVGGLIGDLLTGSGAAGGLLGEFGIGGTDANGDFTAGIGSAAGLTSGMTAGIAAAILALAGGIDGLKEKLPDLQRNPELYQDLAREVQIAFDEGAGDAFGGGVNERQFIKYFTELTQGFGLDPLKGTALGDFASGPLSGLQSVFGIFGSNDPGERSRKAVVDRLNEILNEAVKDFKLNIGGNFDDFSFKRPGEDSFGTPTSVTSADGELFDTTEGFATLFSLGEDARAMFLDIGAALGTSMFDGLEDFAGSGIIGQIGAMLAESTGGSLNNLQLAFEAMGISAEELGAAMEQAFFVGEISAKEYLSGLNAVGDLMAQGIPGAVGATLEAFTNLQEGGLQSGQIAQDALGDIAAEFQEIAEAQGLNANSLDDLGAHLIAAGADIEQVTTLMQTLEQQGYLTVEGLANINTFSTAELISALQDAGFAFDEPVQKLDVLNEKLDELENRRISTYVDVHFNATGDPAARQVVEQGTGVSFGAEGRP
jgi:hypothetical protein